MMLENMMIENFIMYIAGSLAVIIVILIIASVVLKKIKGGSSGLILQEFNFNENDDIFLEVKGRASGFWNWVLSLFNKAPTTSFTCNKRLLKYETNINYHIPMIKISCVSSVMTSKFRWGFFILGLIVFISGLWLSSYSADNSKLKAFVIVLLIVGIIFIHCTFIKKKTIHFGIFLFENKPFFTITLKKGIIKSIDNETFDAAANTLNRIVLANAISK